MKRLEDEEFDYRKRPYNKRERAMLKHKRKWERLVAAKQSKNDFK